MRHHRFHLLDALRGIAAILVVFHHAPPLFASMQIKNAFLAVDFFFCLSGFVIAWSYDERLSAGLPLQQFLTLRLLRLFPLYLLGTLLAILRSPLNPERVQIFHTFPLYYIASIVLALFFLPNFYAATTNSPLYPFNGPSWSLFYELVANMLYATLLRWKLNRIIFPLIMVFSLAFLSYTMLHNKSLEFGWFPHEALQAFARVGFSFPLGVYLARFFRRYGTTSKHSYLVALISIVALVLALSLRAWWAMNSFFHLAFIAILSPLIVLFAARVSLPRVATVVCIVLGELSYPLYTLQVGLNLPRGGAMLAHFSPGRMYFLYCTYVVVLSAICWAAGTYFDEPVRKRISALLRKPAALLSGSDTRA
jgi:peptidoglycan/LPS O-acetylase OafA/YrhL